MFPRFPSLPPSSGRTSSPPGSARPPKSLLNLLSRGLVLSALLLAILLLAGGGISHAQPAPGAPLLFQDVPARLGGGALPQSESALSSRLVKVDLGLTPPALQPGRPYFLAPNYVH